MPRAPREIDTVRVTDKMVKDNLQTLRLFKKQIEQQQKRIEYLESEVLSKHTAALLIAKDARYWKILAKFRALKREKLEQDKHIRLQQIANLSNKLLAVESELEDEKFDSEFWENKYTEALYRHAGRVRAEHRNAVFDRAAQAPVGLFGRLRRYLGI